MNAAETKVFVSLSQKITKQSKKFSQALDAVASVTSFLGWGKMKFPLFHVLIVFSPDPDIITTMDQGISSA